MEHGGWGFLAEPILLGLLVAPSPVGLALSLMTLGAFLIRHPSKMYLRNRHRLDASPRYRIAGRVTLLYGAAMAASLAVAVALAGPAPLIPYVLLSPALAVYAVFDLNNEARRILPELAAPAGLAATAPAVALAGGWGWLPAAALWAILMARSIPSVMYVRARLRMGRGERVNRGALASVHLLFFLFLIALLGRGLAPLLAVVAFSGLAVRAASGVLAGRKRIRAQEIGYGELGYGLAYVLLTALGFGLGL